MANRLDPYGFDGAASIGASSQPVMSIEDASSIARTLNETGEENYGPERLLQLLEASMHRLEEESNATPEEIQRILREDSHRAHEAAWRWLGAHEAAAERAAAACVRSPLEETPLHVLCKLPNPQRDLIEELLAAAPEVAGWTDRHGWLPLHRACNNGASRRVLLALIDAYPAGKIAQDGNYRTPLHYYAQAKIKNPADVGPNVRTLADSGAAELADIGGMLPMHFACAYGASTAVLKGLLEANPDSLSAVENNSRTPIHMAMVNAHQNRGISGVIEFILSHEDGIKTMNKRDGAGNLPLHSLMSNAKTLNSDDPQKLNDVTQCLQTYLKAEPIATPDFLTALQSLPRWLQESAVVSPHVRNILNKKIVQRFPTSVLMLDGYWLIIMIVCFEITTTRHIALRESKDRSLTDPETTGELVILFFGAFYFLFRELIQFISLWNLGSVDSWFTDTNNWLDLAVITLVFYYSILMAGVNEVGPLEFRSGIAFTKGVLWMAVIGFLKSTLVDFAVFVGGVIYVVRRLSAFLAAVGVFLFAFSWIFYVEYRQQDICDSMSDKHIMDFPHCTFGGSLLRVYSAMMGETGTESRYDGNLVAQLVFLAYAFVVVILLSNVLIAIVTDSYEVIQNERAAIVFWSNRLDFVAEIQAIRSVVRSAMTYCGAKPEDSGSAHPTAVKESPSRGFSARSLAFIEGDEDGGIKSKMSASWQAMMDLFESNFFESIDLGADSLQYWVYVGYRIVAITFIIPIWITAGLLTAGWLWPPQVRELLFVQQEPTVSRAEMERQKLDQLREIQNAITTLNTNIRKEIMSDRDELLRMRNDVETIHSECISDLQQVRELMSTLLGLLGGESNE